MFQPDRLKNLATARRCFQSEKKRKISNNAIAIFSNGIFLVQYSLRGRNKTLTPRVESQMSSKCKRETMGRNTGINPVSSSLCFRAKGFLYDSVFFHGVIRQIASRYSTLHSTCDCGLSRFEQTNTSVTSSGSDDCLWLADCSCKSQALCNNRSPAMAGVLLDLIRRVTVWHSFTQHNYSRHIVLQLCCFRKKSQYVRWN